MVEIIKLVIKQVILNIKYMASNRTSLVLILCLLLTSLFIPILFIPFKYAISVIILLGAGIPAGILYTSTTFSWRQSILYNNQSITKNNRYTYYIGSYINVFINMYILLFIQLIALTICQELGVLLIGWRSGYQTDYYHIWQMNLGQLIYATFEMSLIIYGTFYFFQAFIKNEKNIYIILLVIIILGIIYGGVFNDYFSSTGIIVGEDNYTRYPSYYKSLFPDWMFYPTLTLFPLYTPMQHLSSLNFSVWDYGINPQDNILFFFWMRSGTELVYDIYGGHIPYLITTQQAFNWNIMWFMPYIHTGIFCVLGIKLRRY